MSGVIGKGACNGMSSTVQRKASEKWFPTSYRQCRGISLPFRKAPATLALQTKVDYLEITVLYFAYICCLMWSISA